MQMAPAFNISYSVSTEKQLLKHKMMILFFEHLALRVVWFVPSLLCFLSMSPFILSSRFLLAKEHCVPAKVGNGRFSMLSENIVLSPLTA